MGNPNWKQNGPSPNPGGRPKTEPAFRLRARKAVDAKVIARWEREVDENGPDWLRCSELLVAYGYGRPSQAIEFAGTSPLETRFDFSLLTQAEMIEVARSGRPRWPGDPVITETRLHEIILKATPRELVDSVSAALEIAISELAARNVESLGKPSDDEESAT